MQKLNDVFVSGTFAGELLSIEACLKTIEVLERDNVIEKLDALGGFLKQELNKQLIKQDLSNEIIFEGNNWWPRLNIKKTKIDKNIFSSLFRQEIISSGLFLGASLNLCFSHNKENIKKDTIKRFKLAVESFNEIKSSKNPLKYLRGNNIEAVFKVR